MTEPLVSDPVDPQVADEIAVREALAGFDTAADDAKERASMSWGEQCARDIMRHLDKTSKAYELITATARAAGHKCPSISDMQLTFDGMSFILVLGDNKGSMRLSDVFRKGRKSALVVEYHRAAAETRSTQGTVAVFMNTVDAGPVVAHTAVWTTRRDDDDTPRLIVPTTSGNYYDIIVEPRRTFCRLLTKIAFI